jgi:hypothetical protein
MTEEELDRFFSGPTLRFHLVDEANRPRSSAWYITNSKTGLYIGPRALGDHHKLSLHVNDGTDGCNSQYGLTKRAKADHLERGFIDLPPLLRWKREDPRERGVACAAMIDFPADGLQGEETALSERKPKLAFKMPPPGKAFRLCVLEHRIDANHVEQLARSQGLTPMVFIDVAGIKFTIAYRVVDFDMKSLPIGKPAVGRPLSGAPAPGEVVSGCAAIWHHGAPEPGKPIHLVQTTGMSVGRDSPPSLGSA